jgi:hypothetical protein
MFVVAISFALWLAEPPGWAILTCWALILILPGVSIAGAVFFRGYTQAFSIGFAVPIVIYAIQSLDLIVFVPLDWESFAAFISASSANEYAFGLSGLDFYPQHWSRISVVIFTLSIVSGLLAVGMRWLAMRSDASRT